MKGNTGKVAKIKRQQVVEKCHSFHANENPCDKEFLLMDFWWQRISMHVFQVEFKFGEFATLTN